MLVKTLYMQKLVLNYRYLKMFKDKFYKFHDNEFFRNKNIMYKDCEP